MNIRAKCTALAGLIIVSISAGCAGPQTNLGSVSQDLVIVEQARQQQFALREELRQQSRLYHVATPMLRAAVPFCGKSIRSTAGFSAANAYAFREDFQSAARAIGYGDTVTVADVYPGFPAAASGLRIGDRLLAVGEESLATGRGVIEAFQKQTARANLRGSYRIKYVRDGQQGYAEIDPVPICAYDVRLKPTDDVAAFADGSAIIFTSGMLRFLPDDYELSVVVGHEIAHDAMGHIQAQKKNQAVGGLLGALVDIAAAAGGINTGGEFTKAGIEAGSIVFSQDFEREADYVGLYIMSLSGKPLDGSPMVWRRFAAENPKSIKFASSHPTTAERFVRLDQWQREIQSKIARGVVLRPEMKSSASRANTAYASASPSSTAVTKAAVAPSPPVSHLGDTLSTVQGSANAGGTSVGVGPPKKSAANVATPVQSGAHTEPAVTAFEEAQGLPRSKLNAMPRLESTKEDRRDVGTSIIGAPSNEDDRADALKVFARGKSFMRTHEWDRAEVSFRQTLRLDGSRPEYHAALGDVLMVKRNWVGAQAAYTAALLLDVSNERYRRQLEEARSRK